MTRHMLCLAFALPFAVHAQTVPSSYRAVMRAQYAAKSVTQPASAAEARRIYDAYLRDIGVSRNSTHSGESAGMSSR